MENLVQPVFFIQARLHHEIHCGIAHFIYNVVIQVAAEKSVFNALFHEFLRARRLFFIILLEEAYNPFVFSISVKTMD